MVSANWMSTNGQYGGHGNVRLIASYINTDVNIYTKMKILTFCDIQCDKHSQYPREQADKFVSLIRRCTFTIKFKIACLKFNIMSTRIWNFENVARNSIRRAHFRTKWKFR